jgi:MFS family permease
MPQPIRSGAQAGAGAWLRQPATHAILAPGITQIIAWGTTLYALGVLGRPIAEDTGWSQSLVFGGLSIGLLVSAGVSTLVGRAIDRRGGRAVMGLGSLLMAAGLILLALVQSRVTYLLAWAFLALPCACAFTMPPSRRSCKCHSLARPARDFLPDAIRRFRLDRVLADRAPLE